MLEIEKKYKIKKEVKEDIVNFLNQTFKKGEIFNLIDFRYDIKENNFNGTDFKRIRIIKDINKNISFVWTHKYNDAEGVRQEDEKDIKIEEVKNEIENKSGLICIKARIDYHDLIIDNFYFNISIDTIKNDNEFSYLEIETIIEDKEKTDYFLEKIDEIRTNLFSDFDLELENKGMIHFSTEYFFKKINP